MKRLLLVLSLSAVVIFTGSSQETAREKVNAYKIGFFTKRLNLTSSEAEKFWPVYNGFQDERTKIQVEKQKLMRIFNQQQASLSDAEITALGDKLVAASLKETELAVEFHGQLKSILPPAKVIRFYQAENQFRVFLLNELQKRQQNRPVQDRDPADLPDL